MATVLLLIFAVISVRYLGGLCTIMLTPAVLVAFPGAVLAGSRDDLAANPRRYWMGVTYTCIAYNLMASLWIAAVVGYTFYLRQQNEVPFWIVWPFGLLLASIPMYHASRSYYEEREKQKHGIEGAHPNEALEFASGIGWFLSYPLFIALALMPHVYHFLFRWLPWAQFVK